MIEFDVDSEVTISLKMEFTQALLLSSLLQQVVKATKGAGILGDEERSDLLEISSQIARACRTALGTDEEA